MTMSGKSDRDRREELMAKEGVHQIRIEDDEVVVAVLEDPERGGLPDTLVLDGTERSVSVEQRGQAVSPLYKLKRVRAAHRAASEGYQPAVAPRVLREYDEEPSLSASPDARSGPRDEEQRPLAGGLQLSMGGSDGYGTLGCPARVTDTDAGVWRDDINSGDIVLLSNRHLLLGDLGRNVVQPTYGEKVGEICGYLPLESGVEADVAAFLPSSPPTDWDYWELDNAGSSNMTSGYQDYVGSEVTLTGARNGVRTGTLMEHGDSISIDFGGSIGDVAFYDLNRRDGGMSRGGDSGSPCFTGSNAFISLTFASQGGDYGENEPSWGGTAQSIEDGFGVEIMTPEDVREAAQERDPPSDSGIEGGYDIQKGAYYSAFGTYADFGEDDGEGGTPPGEEDPPDGPQPGGDGTGRGDPPFGFSQTLNAVDDLGMDNSGNQATDGQWDFTDGTLIEFPPGDYLISEEQVNSGLDNWGMVGLGETRGDVRFHTTTDEARRIMVWGDGCNNIYVANLTLDQRDSLATRVRINYNGPGDFYMYNTQILGRTPNDDQAGPPDNNAFSGVRLTIQDADRVSNIINHKDITETDVIDYPGNGSAISTYRSHEGISYVRNAWLANKGEHAMYASRPIGDVRIDGGLFENCANTNMRICGEGSWARNATVRIDRPASYFELPGGGQKSTRGLRWESGNQPNSENWAQSGGYVENCDFIYETDKLTSGLVVVDGNAGAMEFRDCRFHLDNSEPNTIIIYPIGSGPGGYEPPSPQTPIAFDTCEFTGDTDEPPIINDREGTIARNCCFASSLSDPQDVDVSSPRDPPCEDPTS